jgi:glycosyltransferase involved in cell wall biosynthesis
MLVSIIMPIFNSREHLEKAIQSVLEQEYSDFELLLIDDCSSDGSADIAKSYARKDARIKFFQNDENSGICATRNRGINYSSGEYITFLDDDDELTKDFLSDNVRLLKKQTADAIKFGRVLIDINKSGVVLRKKETSFYNEHEKEFTSESKYNCYHFFKKNNLLLNVWNGLYRRSVIEKHHILFDESMKFGSEDAKFSYEFFNACENISINPKSYYIHYRRDLSSTSRKYSKNKIDSILETARAESQIWQRITDEKEQKYIDTYKLTYIKTIISSQLLHRDCDLSIAEKKLILQRIIKNEALELKQETKEKAWSLNSLLKFLLKKEYVMLILYMYIGYKRFHGEKWD